MHPIPLEQAMEAERPEEIIDEIDLEELFYPPPIIDGALIAPETLIDSIPPFDPTVETQPAENPPQAPATHEITNLTMFKLTTAKPMS